MHLAMNSKQRLIKMVYSSEAQEAVTDLLRKNYLLRTVYIEKNDWWDETSKAAGKGIWELMVYAEEAIADQLIIDVGLVADAHPFINEWPFGIPT